MTDAEAREMARELVRGSIVEDAVSQFIAQIIKHTHDERVKPLRKQVAALTEQLAAARQDAEEAEAYAGELEKGRDAIDAKLAQAVKLIDLAVELARWDRAPKLRDDMIDFTTEIKGETHDPL